MPSRTSLTNLVFVPTNVLKVSMPRTVQESRGTVCFALLVKEHCFPGFSDASGHDKGRVKGQLASVDIHI